MKKFFLPFLLFLLIPIITHALTTAPQSGVWITPEGALPAEEVMINAFVYNDTKEAVTIVVEFSTETETIAKTDPVTISSESGKTVSVKWIMPLGNKIVSAKIISAKNSLKKDVPSLVGTIGTLSVGKVVIPKTNIKGFFAKVVAKIEEFRLKQLDYFTNLKQKSQGVLGPNTVEDISTILKPDSPGSTEEEKSSVQVHSKEYVTLVYASAGKAFFDNKTFFYISVILIFLFVLKFIFNRFG